MKKKKLKKRIKKLKHTVEWLESCNRMLALKIDRITKKGGLIFMARMKDLFTWFSDKYDIYNEDTDEWEFRNRLFLIDTPPEKGKGIRIVIKHYGDDPQQYMLDLYKGTDYNDDISPDEMFKVLTKAIDGIMVNMPKD